MQEAVSECVYVGAHRAGRGHQETSGIDLPKHPQVFRALYHQKITPSVVVEEKPLYLLWSKDAELDSTKKAVFQANHIVPVIQV